MKGIVVTSLNKITSALGVITVALMPVIVSAQSVFDYDAVPPLLSESAKPMVMLAMSNDHQMFYKAFTDYDDLNGDGVVDTTYDNSIEYAGYFDIYKCYVYSTTDKRYQPVSVTNDRYCNVSANNEWSGNFLNWATMSRIDEVRKVLYGGTRVVDTSALTVLERAFLPNDAHSFAKYYNGLDLGKLTPFGTVVTGSVGTSASGITICNTTRHSGGSKSQAVTDPPLARVVFGNYSLWAANERWQCLYSDEKGASNGNSSTVTGIHAYSSNPPKSRQAGQADGTVVGDYVVRVEVCSDASLNSAEDCKTYPAGNSKPVGILQRFGDDGSVLWGLVTGSYKLNKSGGVLRKNVSELKDEVNTTTDGTFKSAPASGGIVNSIDLLRMVNYNFGDGTYGATDNCDWGLSTFNNGSCTNWGNPFAEILLECYRYFAGKSSDTNFNANDTSLLPGLTTQSVWANPQTEDTACANLNVIAFNASTVSYDGDELSKTSDLNTTKTAKELTDIVGDGEGITNNYYFVGENGTGDNDQLCTAKKISSFGSAEGYCPTAPRLDGSFKAAGLAYHANTSDLRTDIDDIQTVTTYGVTLSPAIPQISLKASSGQSVTILPACRNSSIGGNCGLVDFKIVEQFEVGGTLTGRFYVNWEDSEQGGDYDQDMAGIINYTLTSTKLIIQSDVAAQSTPDKMGFGFIVSGTKNDGFHSISGINSYSGYGCTACKTDDTLATKEFTLGDSVVDGSVVDVLEQPLYYAAKWGGFVDVDGNGIPSSVNEWDQKNNATGALGSDGKPDTYFFAVNPKQLKAQLTNILVSILERTASGTAAAVVTNTGSGEGAIYQALYNSRFAGANDVDSVSWVGTLNGLFIDSYGNIREDNAAPKGTLTDADNVINVYYDPVSKKTKIQRYNLSADGTPGLTIGTPIDVLDVDPIWSARDQLGKVSDYVTQRSLYTHKANTGRYIFTGIDQNKDGIVDATETLDFDSDTFDPLLGSNNFRYLGLDSSTSNQATDIVDYIRGDQVIGYRNRRLDVDGDGTAEPVLLGDIVHSSPVAVGRPKEGYDVAFGDDTYREFRQYYFDRRQVVYVGANDGMLHAFNAGFFNAESSTHKLTLGTETEHGLGDELWAYVPYNVLPHLKWLTMPSYPHVYYVDGSIQYHDVNIFTPSAKHPGGWGTILVVGMRFGGGEYTLDPDSDKDADTSDDITLRSGYLIFDVTDPEQKPELIAEISHEDLGYATTEPTLVKMRAADPTTGSYSSPSVNKWYLVFGSGPAGSNDTEREKALASAISSKPAKIFVFDLKNKSLNVKSTGLNNSFVGGVTSADWTRDYIDDAIYFGVVAGDIDTPTGRLLRSEVSPSADLGLSFSQVLNVTNQPFSATPLTVRDRLGDFWVYSGTGRFYVVEDNFSNAQQSYYGIKERQSGGLLDPQKIDKSNLVNTTDIRVFTNGNVESKTSPGSPISLIGASEPAETFNDVYNAVQNVDGWYFDFERTRSRNFTQAIISDQSLVFTEYQPSGLKCQPEGNGFLNAPHMHVGIPGSFAPLGTNPGNTNGEDGEEVLMSVSLGYGAPSKAVVHQRGDGKKAAIVQTSTGELTTTVIQAGISQGARESWRELIIDWE